MWQYGMMSGMGPRWWESRTGSRHSRRAAHHGGGFQHTHFLVATPSYIHGQFHEMAKALDEHHGTVMTCYFTGGWGAKINSVGRVVTVIGTSNGSKTPHGFRARSFAGIPLSNNRILDLRGPERFRNDVSLRAPLRTLER